MYGTLPRFNSFLSKILTDHAAGNNFHGPLRESIFLSRVEGRGFHVEGEGAIFFFQNFFLEKVIIDAINVIKTNKKNLKSKWRVNIF